MDNQKQTTQKFNSSYLIIVIIIIAVIAVIVYGTSEKSDSKSNSHVGKQLPLTEENLMATWRLEENEEEHSYQIVFANENNFIYALYNGSENLSISKISADGSFTVEENIISVLFTYDGQEHSEKYRAAVSAEKLTLSPVDNGSKFLVGTYIKVEDDESDSIASETNNSNSQETSAVETTEPTTAKTTATTTAAATTKPQVSVSEWKSAYYSYITMNSLSNCQFNLIYVDNDSVPELHITGPDEASGEMLCTYYNGKVEVLRLPRLFGTYYIEKSGLVEYSNGSMGYYTDIIYKLENGKFKILHQGTNEEINEPTSFYCVYIMDGKEVSQEVYTSTLNSAFNLNACESANGFLSYYKILDELE